MVKWIICLFKEGLLVFFIFRCGKQKREKSSVGFLAVLHQIYMYVRVKADSPKFMLGWKEIKTNSFYTAWLKQLLFQIPLSNMQISLL